MRFSLALFYRITTVSVIIIEKFCRIKYDIHISRKREEDLPGVYLHPRGE